MIKTLFFISALLLLPGLGYAGNPSAPFSDQAGASVTIYNSTGAATPPIL
jgi:hypothetical protein